MLKRDYRFSGMKSNQNNPPFIWRKAVPGRRVIRVLELPRAIQVFIHSLTKRGEQLTWDERKSWLGFSGGRPSSRANVSPQKHFGSPSQGQLGQGETIRACATAVLDNFCRGGVKHGQWQTLLTQTSSPKTETWELFPTVLQTFCLTLCETTLFQRYLS